MGSAHFIKRPQRTDAAAATREVHKCVSDTKAIHFVRFHTPSCGTRQTRMTILNSLKLYSGNRSENCVLHAVSVSTVYSSPACCRVLPLVHDCYACKAVPVQPSLSLYLSLFCPQLYRCIYTSFSIPWYAHRDTLRTQYRASMPIERSSVIATNTYHACIIMYQLVSARIGPCIGLIPTDTCSGHASDKKRLFLYRSGISYSHSARCKPPRIGQM